MSALNAGRNEGGRHGPAAMSARRVCLHSIFLCSLELYPKHRLRFIRHTIKLAMASSNWGLAAQYLSVRSATVRSGLLVFSEENATDIYLVCV